MKNKTLKKGSLLLLCLGLLTGCGEQSSVSSTGSMTDGQIYVVYENYKANGGTLSYEEWLASIKGEDGVDGADGKDGTQIYTGVGTPSSSSGKTGDIYIDTQSGDMYSRGEAGWMKTGNIKGADGEAGKDGMDGVSISGVSKTSTSANVDTYTITYSDGTTSTFTVTNGTDGEAGAKGEKGEDGHTPTITIGTNGNWFVDGEDTGYSATGPKGNAGETGRDGVSIVSITKTDGDGSQGTYDTYTIYYSDDTTSTFKVYNGKDGADGNDGHTPVITIGDDGFWYVDGITTNIRATGNDGNDGKGISGVSLTSSDDNVDTYTITYSDGATSIFTVTNGKDGMTPYIGENGHWFIADEDTGVSAKGEKGEKGADGISVIKSYIDDNGDLICEMSDGSTINAGHVKDTTKHTVTFHVDDEVIQTVSVEDGAKVSTPSDEATAGYTVSSWNSKDDGGYRWLFSAYTVTSDLDLYADFTCNEYTVSFVDKKNRNTIDSQTVTYDNAYTLPQLTGVTGYTHSAWLDSDGKSYDMSGTWRTTNDVTLYADWVVNENLITLDPNSGTVSSTEITVTYDSVYELPTPTRTNYVFLGWYDSNDKKVSSKATWKGTENLTLTAKWTDVTNTYSFDAGDGTCYTNTMVIGWEDAYTLPTPTAPSGLYFIGWYLNDTLIPQSGDSWTYSNAGGTFEAKYTSFKLDSANKTITYGLYPQAYVSDESLISALNALTTAESNGWYLYNYEYYAKLTANSNSSSYTFDDGTAITKGTTYWFKCEPITWKILESSDGGEYKLLSNVILDAHRFNEFYSGTDENGYYANNYAQSEIRAWLNGTFYDTAFSLDNTAIQTTTVDNSAATTYSTANTYACENTEDKVYLLSYQDYINADYGFSRYISRECKATEYARAMGVSCNSDYNGDYWTRSPYSRYSFDTSYVGYEGDLDFDSVSTDVDGVRPSISVKIS